MKKMRNHLFCLIGCFCMLTLTAFSETLQLGVPPTFPTTPLPQEDMRAVTRATRVSVNPQSQQASKDFYYSHYVGSEGVAMGWTGTHGTCTAGTTTQAYKNAMLLELNYFRAMAGVPAEVTFYSTYNSDAQKAALMMSANGQLSHSPDSSWACYTPEGAVAAGKSNLRLGYPTLTHNIAGYMKDTGDNNYAAGHRRWVLYPQTQLMGTGDVPSAPGYQYAANALWVFDSNYGGIRPTTREEYVAWPSPGYVPYQVVYPRWSFAYASADFGSAAVAMTQNGNPISATLETYKTGYGENTLVWRPFGMAHDAAWPAEHLVTYTVTVSNVFIGGSPRSFTYTVRVFDPAQPVTSSNSYLLWTR